MAINFLDEEEFDLDNASTFQFDDDLFSDSRVKDDSIISSYDFFKMNLGAGLENFNELYDSYMPDFLADAGRALYESGAEGLEDYYPEYPSGLYSANDKLGWVLERTAEGATTNAGLLLASGISQNLMRSPMPLTKAFGAAGQAGTFGMNWLLQFNENVGVHTANANKTLSEFDAGERGRLFGASTINALLDQLPRNFAIKGTGNKSYNKKSIKEIYERFNKAEKQEFVQSMVVFAKKAMGTSFREMFTETGQTTVSELTSATGIEGLKSGEELASAAAVGAAGGVVMGSGPAVIEAGSFNRQLKKDEKTLDAFNLGEVKKAGEDYGVNVKNYEKQYQDLVDSYEGPELDVKLKELGPRNNIPDVIPERIDFKRLEKGPLSKLTTATADTLLNRSTASLERIRDNTKTGKDAYSLNRILRGFGDVETGTGEFQSDSSFNTKKHNYVGELLTPFGNIRDKWTNAYPLVGQFGGKIGKNIDKYFGQSLEAKVDAKLKGEVARELGAKKMAELEKDIVKVKKIQKKVFNSLAKTLGKDGLKINFQKDYLTRGIDRDAVKANPEGFLKSLHAEFVDPITGKMIKGVKIEDTKHPVTKEVTVTADEVRNRILNDILNDIDPSVQTSEQIRKVKTRTGAGRPTFEKSRDGRWNNLPEEFRKKSAFESVGDYLLNASTRLASADAFGANSANRLNDDVNNLLESGAITNTEAQKMWDMYDAVHHVYKRPQDDVGRTRQLAYKTIATAAAVKYLGMATISSITEPAWIGQRVGFTNMLKALPTISMTALSGIKRSVYAGGVGKGPSTSFGRDLIRLMGFAVDPAMNEKVQKLMAGDRNEFLGVYFRTPAGLFLTQYTNFVRTWSAVAGLKMIEGQAKKLNRLKGNKKQRLVQELRENGMTIEDFAAMYRAGGNKIDILNDTWLDTNITKSDGTQTRVRDLMVPWLRKITTDVALEPTATNRPLWMSNPDMQLLAQLKSFPILFGNTVAKRAIRKMNPKACTPDLMGQMSTVAAIGAALGLAAIAMAIKDEIRGSDREHTPLDLVGAIGIPLVGETSLSGYIGGPSVSIVDDFLKSAYGNGLAETLAGTPEQFYDIILRATLGSLGAKALENN
tara:strand:- start:1442 stop:4753 length:3312 start_codon:yes stop_codon:yes gene_type:complete